MSLEYHENMSLHLLNLDFHSIEGLAQELPSSAAGRAMVVVVLVTRALTAYTLFRF